jgi:hypothetical protein
MVKGMISQGIIEQRRLMDEKREVPIVKCSGGKLLSQRVRFNRSTFDWAVCSEPLARLRRTRAYGDSIVSWRSVLGGKFELRPEIGGRGCHGEHNLWLHTGV